MITYWNTVDLASCGESLLPLLTSWIVAFFACVSWIRSA